MKNGYKSNRLSVVEITDIVADTHEDPIIKEGTVILGEQAARTVETIRWNVVKAGTNVNINASLYGNV